MHLLRYYLFEFPFTIMFNEEYVFKGNGGTGGGHSIHLLNGIQYIQWKHKLKTQTVKK